MQSLPQIQNINADIIQNCIAFNSRPTNLHTRQVDNEYLKKCIEQLTSYVNSPLIGDALYIDGKRFDTHITYDPAVGATYGSGERLTETKRQAMRAKRVRITTQTEQKNHEYVFLRSGKGWYLQINDLNEIIPPNDFKVAQLLNISVHDVRALKEQGVA